MDVALVGTGGAAGDSGALAKGAVRKLVIDTNVALDLLVFRDAASQPLRDLLAQAGVQWLATEAMHQELERVLAYEKIVPRLAFYGLQAQAVLQAHRAHCQWVATPLRARVVCRDPDDQGFVDLAVAHQATLISKDRAVLALRRRLQPWGVQVLTGPKPAS
jgi:putative PIN family toxin of toxin-antitoxin system